MATIIDFMPHPHPTRPTRIGRRWLEATKDWNLDAIRVLVEEEESAVGDKPDFTLNFSLWLCAVDAAGAGKLDVVEYFVVEKGVRSADLTSEQQNAYVKHNLTCLPPISAAIAGGHEEVALFLASHLQEGEADRYFKAETVLYTASSAGMLALIKSLVLLHGVDISLPYRGAGEDKIGKGHCPPCVALINGHTKIVQFYLRHFESLGKKEEFLQKPCDDCCSFVGFIPYFSILSP